MGGKVIEIKNNNQIVLAEKYPKILYFTAKWCAPCQRIAPEFNKLSEEYIDIDFFKIDVDNNHELAHHFGITGMPTFIFFKSKNEKNTFTGAHKEKLENYILWMCS